MKLKYYHGAEQLEFGGPRKQYRISVITSSRKRVLELIKEIGGRSTIGHVSTYFSMTNGPSVFLQDKPCEESVWLYPTSNTDVAILVWPRPFKVGDEVRFNKHVQDMRPYVVRSVSNGHVKTDDGKTWGWGSLMLDSEWQKKHKL